MPRGRTDNTARGHAETANLTPRATPLMDSVRADVTWASRTACAKTVSDWSSFYRRGFNLMASRILSFACFVDNVLNSRYLELMV